ncbi:MAG: ATP-binding protein [Treponema sp.]|nr:ATP-binding protein [Treponema sp.]MCL2271890.1 ATP-binding protein [Treponema sp.]
MQFLIVFTAFFLMVFISYYFGSNIIKKHISSYGGEVINASVEAMNAHLNDYSIMLSNIAFSVERLHKKGAGIEAMENELAEWTMWIHTEQQTIDPSVSFYGVIYDKFIDGGGWIPDSSYIPQLRPWYTGAYKDNGCIHFSDPHPDMETGENNISISKLVFDENNEPFGVVALNIYISSISRFIENMDFMGSGYGVLLDADRYFIVHPIDDFFGNELASINGGKGGYSQMAMRLAAGEDLSAFPFISYKNLKSVAFSKKLKNGWYSAIILPSNNYNRDIRLTLIVMSVAGLILAIMMCGVVAYMHLKAYRSDEASKTKSSFLANMSHEIRTPMFAIIGMSEFLQHERLSGHQMEFVNDINTSARSLLSIINDILDMSKIEAGKLTLMPINFDFHVFLDNIKSMIMYITDKKGLEFKFETIGEIPRYLYGDDIRLRQVLANIGGNAVKYTARGCVSMRVKAVDDKLLFEIEDTGSGISKEEISRIFNAFEQLDTKENRTYVGTGLGLSICKSYVEMMNGNIMVESELGRGTTFTVEIPAVLGSDENINANSNKHDEHMLSAPDANVLVVDDNEFNLKTVEALLSLFNIKTKSAYSGYEAIEKIKKEDFDIVFMDHMMPEMDGIETVHEIRKFGNKYHALVIIALTANAIYGARDMFISSGFNGFVSKPVEMNDLRKILMDWLPVEKIKLTEKNSVASICEQADIELRKALQRMFLKNSRGIFKDLTEAMKSGNIELAHRLVHTLKGNAGQMGEKTLQKAAIDVESRLRDGKNSVTKDQLTALETELNIVFRALSNLHLETSREKPKTSSNKNNAVFMPDKKFFNGLEDLLKSGNPESLNSIDNLRALPGDSQTQDLLIKQMEDFDFTSALNTFYKLKQELK